ncbi:MAG: hypothetical protein HZC29_01090 [Thaumarchaeota archaeon]|nr:hypothetical protein [Nitrososphaerota archaeon]
MTITYQYLEGNWEELEETLRAFFYSKWDSTKTGGVTPTFKSPQGIDNQDPSTSIEKVEVAWKDGGDRENLIVFNQRGVYQKRNDTAGNHVIPLVYHIYVDVFAEDIQLLGLFIKHLNDIVQDYLAVDLVQIKKCNGTQNSAISGFDEEQIEWSNPNNPKNEFKELWSVVQRSGIIKPIVYKFKTA